MALADRGVTRAALFWAALVLAACSAKPSAKVVLTLPTSAVGAEAEVLDRQVSRFEAAHPEIRVERRVTPDAAEQRRQLYVEWLNAGVSDPDILQLDVIWTAEFAAAGWILPLDRFGPPKDEFFFEAIDAGSYAGSVFALPWFVDVGMLYTRTDLVDRPPETFAELDRAAERARRSGAAAYGFVWPGARYEGLVTVFLEHLGGFGGRLSDDSGRLVVDSPEARRALEQMWGYLERGITPEEVLSWQEEQTRHAFESGRAAFMRNWPYAYSLLQADSASKVRGRFAVSMMPKGPGGTHTAALGGQQLAINANTEHPREAYLLIDYLTRPEQMLERARLAGQLPARRSVYDDPDLARALPFDPPRARQVIEHARARPASPIYSELSSALQVELHRALSGQIEPGVALRRAAEAVGERLHRAGLERAGAPRPRRRKGSDRELLWVAAALAVAVLVTWRLLVLRQRSEPKLSRADRRFAAVLVAPALIVMGAVALFPLLWTLWESLHADDLRMPWQGRPFVGIANYVEAARSDRFWGAIGHTALFVAASVSLEILFGLALAQIVFRGRARRLLRATLLLPWVMPTVVAGLLWRFVFDGRESIANLIVASIGLEPVAWLAHSVAAWVPIVLGDVWKTTPFVALLSLAALETIDETYHEAARVDGARPFQVYWHVTLPLLLPTLLVVVVFRSLDALRVFDLVYVLTGGGPGTATEPISMLAFKALLESLRFGYGAALAVVVLVIALGLAVVYVRAIGSRLPGRRS